MDTGEADAALSSILAHSRNDDNAIRVEAIPGLGRNIRSSSARERLQEIWSLPSEQVIQRLSELLGDDDMAVELEATEVLARFGGRAGLVAILGELGRRVDDPDSDYIAYRLQELQTNDGLPILQNSRKIMDQSPSHEVSEGINQIEQLFGYLAPKDK
ncbi:hypothetical protein [Nocardia sp. SC052]|uniref:hypothetical protein n=1 Tax=Nocardia sichangensis TaxID=3385975 RepID=UPI0039A3727F